MEKVMQCTEDFFADGTFGAENGKNTLENVISRMNDNGWRVDQIVPLSFRCDSQHQYYQEMRMTGGVLLCSK